MLNYTEKTKSGKGLAKIKLVFWSVKIMCSRKCCRPIFFCDEMSPCCLQHVLTLSAVIKSMKVEFLPPRQKQVPKTIVYHRVAHFTSELCVPPWSPQSVVGTDHFSISILFFLDWRHAGWFNKVDLWSEALTLQQQTLSHQTIIVYQMYVPGRHFTVEGGSNNTPPRQGMINL